MDNKSPSFGVLEYVNLALAIFSWLFSDIDFYIKVSITAILFSIVILSKVQWASWLRKLSIKPTVILFGFPIISSFVMYQMASFCYTQDFFDLLSNSEPLLALSLIYGLLIGLPIVLIGATFSKHKFEGIDLGLLFSCIWLILIFSLKISIENSIIWRTSILGPMVYMYLGNKCGLGLSDDFWVMIIIVLISFFLIPGIFYYFGITWRRKNDSL